MKRNVQNGVTQKA